MNIKVKKVKILTAEGFVTEAWGLFDFTYYAWYSRYYQTEASAESIKARFEALHATTSIDSLVALNFVHNYPFLGA